MSISSQNLKTTSSAKSSQKPSAGVILGCVSPTAKESKAKKSVKPSYDFVGIAG